MSEVPPYRPVPLEPLPFAPSEALRKSGEFLATMSRRRSTRDFSDDPVPLELIHDAIATATTAPSGANLQPWHFVIVSDPELKAQIRQGAEAEERAFYEKRGSTEWLAALAPLGTDWRKPFLEAAPYLIVVFEVHKGEGAPKPYYAKESVGIAVGLLLASLTLAGLATLTHTPSPMRFLNRLTGRPRWERPFALIPVGRPAPGAMVPDLTKKPLGKVMTELPPGQL